MQKKFHHFLILACLLTISTKCFGHNQTLSTPTTGSAGFTYYNSYPFCCKESPNYDPNAPTDECDDYSGCKYIGDFAGYESESNPDGYKSFDFVQSNNLVAFYDDSDPTGMHWQSNYALKTIRITKTYDGKVFTFDAIIADTCGNSDCAGCCSRNSRRYGGFLLDIEYYTAMNTFGTVDAIDGSVDFVIL